jgi:cytochrome c551/c552
LLFLHEIRRNLAHFCARKSKWNLPMKCLIAFLLCFSFILQGAELTPEEKEGETVFNLNCLACHILEQVQVGPSLIEIAHIYRKNPEGIVTWSMEPGQKRPGAITMPPMSHLGKETLAKVGSYILAVTKGKKYVPQKDPSDPFEKFPLPKIQRLFLPNAGPAAIAVSLSDKLHFCWDAGSCNIRYGWTGDFLDPWPVFRGNGDSLAKIKGTVFFQNSPKNPFALDGDVKFEGYRKVNGLPIFMYNIGLVAIEESFSAVNSESFDITYKTNFSGKELKFQPSLSSGEWSSKNGTIENGVLTLTGPAVKEFTVTYKGASK